MLYQNISDSISFIFKMMFFCKCTEVILYCSEMSARARDFGYFFKIFHFYRGVRPAAALTGRAGENLVGAFNAACCEEHCCKKGCGKEGGYG